MKCPYCGKEYSAYFLKKHIRYFCHLNPERDICVKRKKITKKIEEVKEKMKEDVRHEEYFRGWIDALEWLLNDKMTKGETETESEQEDD